MGGSGQRRSLPDRAPRCAVRRLPGARQLLERSQQPGNPKYGVSSSSRVVATGEPVPKGGGDYRVGKPYVVGGAKMFP